MKIFYTILVILVIALVGAAIGFNLNQPPEKAEQVNLSGIGGSPYNSTSTYSGLPWADVLLQTGYGTLGSYIVLGANTTQFDILDATTTNIYKRTGQKASTSILMVSVPSSATAGVYTFDTVFTDGLYIDVKATGVGTSTLTWK